MDLEESDSDAGSQQQIKPFSATPGEGTDTVVYDLVQEKLRPIPSKDVVEKSKYLPMGDPDEDPALPVLQEDKEPFDYMPYLILGGIFLFFAYITDD